LISAPAGTVAIQPNVSAAMACVASCFEFAAPRNRVVYESLMFPSVSYVWKAEERRGAEVVVVESADGATIDADAVCAAIDERTLLVPIQHVVFSSAFIQDVKKIARRAAAVGAHVILDCYQSIGAMPIDVVDLGVAFACGGSVKYLCGGPGAGWLYVRKDLDRHGSSRARPAGSPTPTRSRSRCRRRPTPRASGATSPARPRSPRCTSRGRATRSSVRSASAAIRDKSLALTGHAIELVDEAGFKLNSPRAAERRGGSVVFDFVGAADVARELNRRRFFCDHRPASGIRIAPHFYTKREELDLFFAELRKIRG
jgi:kynureninase